MTTPSIRWLRLQIDGFLQPDGDNTVAVAASAYHGTAKGQAQTQE
jgi:hypothetical protein